MKAKTLLQELLFEDFALKGVKGSNNPKIKLTDLDKQIKELYAQERAINLSTDIDDATKRARLAVINRRIEKLLIKKEKPYDRSKNLKRK